VADELQVFTDPFKADEFIQAHVCSACWGLLIKTRPVREERRWIVRCEECGESTKGYVTRAYAQRRAEASYIERQAARAALRDAVPWMRSNKSPKQLLKELGINP
jgi:hypothetical protein